MLRSFRRARTIARVTTRVIAPVLATAMLGVGCMQDRTVGPDAEGAARGPLRLALGVRVLAAASQLDVRVYYFRADRSTVELSRRQLALESGTQPVSLGVDLGPCLADATRLGADAGANVCTVGAVLTIAGSGASLDSVAVLPLAVSAGETRSVGDDLSLGGGEWRRIDVGFLSTCGLRRDGAVYCWGNNEVGQLGTGGTVSARAPVRVGPALRFARLAVGPASACALTAAGQAYCWGLDEFGALGRGARSAARCASVDVEGELNVGRALACGLTPEAVVGAPPLRAIAPALLHTCALDAGGRAYCWGLRVALGAGGTDEQPLPTPTPVLGGRTYASISGGALHTCAVTGAGAAYCWGANGAGQLGVSGGDGTQAATLAPVAVGGGLAFRSVSAGWDVTCGVTTGDQAYCWGSNASLQHGVEARTSDAAAHPEPRRVALAQPIATIETGGTSTCAVTRDGAAFCWGSNDSGALGIGAPSAQQCTNADGAFRCSPLPAPVVGGLVFADVQVGVGTACGVTRTGAAFCWGDDEFGQLGAGRTATTPSFAPTPVRSPGGLLAAALPAGPAIAQVLP